MVRNVGKQWISIVLLWHSKGKVETMSMGFNKNKVESQIYNTVLNKNIHSNIY